MYLKLIRHRLPWGQWQRGTLYTVHFQPNEKGGYNEHLTLISDVYETAAPMLSSVSTHTKSERLPPALIYPVGIRLVNGRQRLSFGRHHHRSMLHMIDMQVRERFFSELRLALLHRTDVRIEVVNNSLT